jgi:predicted CopG family antitoxin
MKHKIMEVLLSSDNNLTKAEIDWAIKNIPNIDNNLSNFDHDNPKLMQACGITAETKDIILEEYKKIRKMPGTDSISKLIENLVKSGSQSLLFYFFIKGIISVESKEHNAHDIIGNIIKSILEKE